VEKILFDLDGTLTDPKTGTTVSIQFTLNKLGLSLFVATSKPCIYAHEIISQLNFGQAV